MVDDKSPYFNPEQETLTREGIEALQLERLQATVKHCMNSPFYKKRFEEMGLKPEDIKSLDDVRITCHSPILSRNASQR